MRAILDLLQRLHHWALCYYDSTRSIALIRIGLVCLVWSRWGGELLLFRDMHLHVVLCNSAFFLATSLMFIGLWTRIASLATATTIAIIYLSRESSQHHHTYLLLAATFLIALTPSGRSYSLDRWLALRRARKLNLPRPSEIGNLWGLRLIAIQLALIYFWTGYDKLKWAFLSGERMQFYIYNYYSGLDYKSFPGFTMFCFLFA